ncbi:MAG: hypothetical protein MZU97_21265 [Bacillus subtilis]|nr:hypothetical protein [Bacillus subtilis]
MKTKLLLVLSLFLVTFLAACGVASSTSTTTSTATLPSSETTTSTITTTTTTTTSTQTTTSTTEPTTTTTTTTTAPEAVADIIGVEDTTVVLNHYFHPLRNVQAVSQKRSRSDVVHSNRRSRRLRNLGNLRTHLFD